jgi:hypothetical protein
MATLPPRALRDHLDEAAEARRRGDHAAADAAEVQALLTLRSILLPAPAGEAVRA